MARTTNDGHVLFHIIERPVRSLLYGDNNKNDSIKLDIYAMNNCESFLESIIIMILFGMGIYAKSLCKMHSAERTL